MCRVKNTLVRGLSLACRLLCTSKKQNMKHFLVLGSTQESLYEKKIKDLGGAPRVITTHGFNEYRVKLFWLNALECKDPHRFDLTNGASDKKIELCIRKEEHKELKNGDTPKSRQLEDEAFHNV